MSDPGKPIKTSCMDNYYTSSLGTIFGFLLGLFLRPFLTLNRPQIQATRENSTLPTDDDSDDHKMVILVRTDLNMTKGKAAAQCCHACLAAYKRALHKSPTLVSSWESAGQPKVTLKTDSQQQLEELQKRAREAGLVAEAIRDAGKTQLVPGTKTVCAIGPGPAKLINLITGHLKLY